MILLTLASAIAVSGINVLFAAIGATLGFWQTNRFVALISAAVITFMGAFLTGIVIFPEIMLRALYNQAFDVPMLFAVLMIIFVPYILAFGLIRAASHLVRRPSIS